jgi:hypothetical protein
VLCILSSILCVYYGVTHWNLDGEDEAQEQKQWMADETEIEKPL